MNRKADMNHVVYSGWMIKSPPEKKLTGPWKIFRAKWKRRYFVLSKPAQSLPGAYILNYFSDENCKKLKGYIDLDQCLEIIESLDSDQFQYLLAIKTTHKGKERTYFLATDTEEQMTTWVRNLCTVCGMKPEESEPEPPRPPHREEASTKSPPRAHNTPKPNQPSLNHNAKLTPSQRHNITPPTQRHIESTTTSQRRVMPTVTVQPQSNVLTQVSEYIPLETCSSGPSVKRTPRQISIDSVPDEIAPPPPVKGGGNESDNEVFSQTYDVPPSARIEEDEIYKVPPPRTTLNGMGAPVSSEIYDIPPERSSPSTPRSSSSESHKGDSHLSQDFLYDSPPSRENVATKDDVYDIPPSHSDSVKISKISLEDVPPRPPKPSYLISQPAQEPYMNLPMNSKVFTDINRNVPIPVDIRKAPPPASCAGMVMTDAYDIPLSDNVRSVKSGDLKDKLLNSTPPPPSQCGMEHKYINAAAGFLPDQDVYLPMDPVLKSTDALPPEPRNSSSTDNEVEYTDMSGKSSFDDSFESKQVYDHPPVRPAPRSDKPPQRPRKPDTTDTYHIYQTHRTRSFKKSSSSAGSPMLTRRTTPTSLMKTTVQLPISTREMRHPDFSTSDEDDDDVLGSPLWETTPPAPGSKDPELKYIDLEHDESAEQPVRSPVGASSSLQPTEYHEIDFVKTDALKNVRETTTKERQKQADS